MLADVLKQLRLPSLVLLENVGLINMTNFFLHPTRTGASFCSLSGQYNKSYNLQIQSDSPGTRKHEAASFNFILLLFVGIFATLSAAPAITEFKIICKKLEAELPAECMEQFRKNDCRSCGPIPESLLSGEQSEECTKNCEAQDECCIYDCCYEIDGTIMNGTFSKENYLENYKIYFETYNETATGKDEWMVLIEKFVESSSTCKIC